LHYLLHQLNGASFPGVLELISELHTIPDSPVLGLLTGNIRLGAELKLRRFGIWNFFRSGAFGDDHEDRNELARIAQQRASRLMGKQLTGEEILVIGDTPRDIECARGIGAGVLAVGTGGFTCNELCEHKPNWLFETLESVNAVEICR